MASLRDAISDLARANRAYLVDPGIRGSIRGAVRRGTGGPSSVEAREHALAPESTRPYAGLTGSSLAIAATTQRADAAPHLNLVLASLPAGGAFAGIHTAIVAAGAMASKLGLPVRVLTLDPGSADSPARVENYLERSFGLRGATVLPREGIAGATVGVGDVWLATHWKTAHALQVAVDGGVLDRGRIAYLIQDYEPGFSAWSTESVLAESTYRADFVPIVNSTPLWRHLADAAGLVVDRELVFAPEFDDKALRNAARARRKADDVTVLYYGRPSKPRNLFRLGLSALRATALALPGDASVRFVSAGEAHDPFDLGGGRSLVSLGRLSWDDYFVTLAEAQVVLSLQQTPHPSHPPFDAAISGALAVTNDFAGARQGLHPRILAAQADTASLSRALLDAIALAGRSAPADYLPVQHGLLGGSLADAVDAAIARLAIERG